MNYFLSYTPRHWEFGFGFYLGGWYENAYLNRKTYQPTEFTLLVGPWSLVVGRGSYTEVLHERSDMATVTQITDFVKKV